MKYKIEICLKLHKTVCANDISIEVLLMSGCETVKCKRIMPDKQDLDITISDILEWELPAFSDKCRLFIKLISDESVRVENGKISVEELFY
jgi:hypothetical protein